MNGTVRGHTETCGEVSTRTFIYGQPELRYQKIVPPARAVTLIFKIIALLCIGTLISIPCHAASNSHKISGGEKNEPAKQITLPSSSLKTIIVGDYYPYTFVNDKGVPDGFSVDVAKAVTRVMDLRLEIRVDTWQSATAALSNGTIDLLPMMAYSPERDKVYDFSAPHTIAYDAVFSRTGAQKIRTLKDLGGKTVIVMNKDAAHQYLLSSGMAANIRLILVNSLPDALRTLAEGKGDAALMPKLVGLIIIKNQHLANLDQSPVVISAYNRPFSFAVRDGNLALLERLSQGLSIIKSTGEYQEIYNKWFGTIEPTGMPWGTVIKYTAVIVSVFILVALSLIIWNVSLRKQVSLRTKKLAEEIEERELAQEELRKTNQLFTLFMHHSPIYAYIKEVAPSQGFVLQASENFEKMVGVSGSKMVGKTMTELFPPELAAKIIKDDWTVVSSGDVLSTDEELNGRSYTTVKFPIVMGGKTLLAGYTIDITERKEAEKQLNEMTRRLRLATDSAKAGVWDWNLQTNEMIWDDRMHELYGLTHENFPGGIQAWEQGLHPDDSARAMEECQAALRGEADFDTEFRVKHPDGTVVHIKANGLVLRDEAGKPIRMIGLNSDISERRKAQEERKLLTERLQRSEKMEALGQLAGGVAHDLNNVLGVTMAYAEMLQEQGVSSQQQKKFAENILSSTQKAATIIQDLLTLARRGVPVSQVIDLSTIISMVFSSPELDKLRDFHPSVIFKKELPDTLLNIHGSPVHLEKTMFNLLSNAAEAISGRGAVTIRAENRYLDRPVQGYDTVQEGEYVVVSVSDSGQGIVAGELRKIFEPFYTKKSMGRSGTGLGLAIVWGTVKDHNGYIDVQSEEGKGTTFNLYFPVTREQVSEEEAAVTVDQFRGNGEKVLVIDDAEGQRDVACNLLNGLGYEVHAVSSGEAAIEYLKGNSADILVLDMIMAPGIDGLETYRRIRQISPGQKAVIVSGYSETDRVKEAQKLGAGAYVKKPYLKEKIGLALRDELRKAARGA